MKKKMVQHGLDKKKNNKEVHGDTTPFLPDEIVTYILKRLPVKSLIRFQCVCKHWKSLIKSPSFVSDHLHHPSNQNPGLVFQQRGADDANPITLFVADCKIGPLDVQEVASRMRYSIYYHSSIIGTCNGLICVRFDPSLFLWNPATREVRRLSGVIYDDGDDVSDDYFYFGFGYSPLLNDYKIVKIFIREKFVDEDERERVYWVKVYSLKTDSWREIESGNIKGVEKFNGNTCVNGSVYWNVWSEGENWEQILAFDLAKEVFTWIPLPLLDFNITNIINIFVYEKKLALFCDIRRTCLSCFWVMEEGVDAFGGKEWNWTKADCSKPYLLSHLDLDEELRWRGKVVDYTFLYVESLVPIFNIASEESTS